MGFEGKIAIGIPHAGDIPGYFLDTLLGLSKPEGTWVIRVQNKPIDLARNLIAEAVLSQPDYTHLFFMDADMQFHTDALLRLVQRDKPVVGGTYFSRTDTPIPHAYDFHHQDDEDGRCPVGWEHEGETGRWYRPLHYEFSQYLKAHPELDEFEMCDVLPPTDDSLIECDALATGSLLIKREVLEAIRDMHPGDRHPWFKCHPYSAGGEDFYFCEQAKAAGYPVYADFSVQSKHEFRGLFMARDSFIQRFAIGTDHEYDFTMPIVVDASPGRAPLVEEREAVRA